MLYMHICNIVFVIYVCVDIDKSVSMQINLMKCCETRCSNKEKH